MTSGGRQRRDGSSKRVQLTSGDHGGPKDKKPKGQRKTSSLGGEASRAARLCEVERFRDSIRAAEQRRAARPDSPAVTPPVDMEQPVRAKEHLADANTVLQVHLAACVRAAQDQDWSLLRDSACQLAEAAARLDAEARPGRNTHQDDAAF
ncbi:hypothetical protein BM536_037065 [Streptomyces phaeoluteigriseus]|uniref:Uncharacterized protein n=1 Tax=Streptomyces phaeoluteigriseus TaxID=114686 RepID=A0A1V6MHK4_9ACTN|nr:hypothetical protein [Streptomyces phaeoluteigriseus]OQD51944.1 hypothetical protein BM536_037065 [Streptomyces phaeoluteigriseus]